MGAAPASAAHLGRKTMTKFLLACVLLAMSAGVFSDQTVRGYTRKDGTYVQPYQRSSPDSSYNNNWSTSPNTNPYTGRQGTRQPTWNDQPPPQQQPGYGNSNRNNQRGW